MNVRTIVLWSAASAALSFGCKNNTAETQPPEPETEVEEGVEEAGEAIEEGVEETDETLEEGAEEAEEAADEIEEEVDD